MRKIMRSVMLLPVIAALTLAGPPGGGGHSSGGGHSGGGHATAQGRAGGYGLRSGPPAVSGPTPIGASGSAPVGGVGSLRPVYGFNGGRHYPGNGRRGGQYPYGYYPGPFAMPFYGYGGYGDDSYDSGYSAQPDQGPDPQAAATNSVDVLGQQVQQLTAEIQDMQNQQQQQGQPASAVAPQAAAPQGTDSDVQNDVPVTLVLHSGQQLQVKNYAVTDGVFWDFSRHPAQKIPVASIDLAASEKATEANGGDFPPITQ